MTLTQTSDLKELKEVARRLRVKIIEMTAAAGSGHPSTSLSSVEIVTALHFSRMRWDPKNAGWDDRDRFIISKGHGVPVLYAAYAQAGAIPDEELKTLRQTGSRLQGHPDPVRLPFVEAATGSLGQGLSIAMGLAIAAKLDKASWRTYCLLGDGECEEGQVWEAAMSAPRFELDNLCAIVDFNKIQQTSSVEEILPTLNPLPEKWRAFSWHVIECDGHDVQALLDAFDEAASTTGTPTVVIAHTVKGKGVSYMENANDWHGKAPNADQAKQAIEEILS
ncbi:MAG TPA: transketolase [Actinomycetota bacterium]|jgi:transketolase|nr:transketolase [Actinomycetota bacterium]